jgi:hypothetical protein
MDVYWSRIDLRFGGDCASVVNYPAHHLAAILYGLYQTGI